MKFKKSVVFLLFYFLINSIAYSQAKIDFNLLIGKWKFVKFEWPNFVPETAKIRQESSHKFDGTIYNFSKDKHITIIQPNAPKGYTKNLTYTIKGNKVYVLPVGIPKAEPQILEIDFLDKSSLVFYVVGSDPVATFKRVNM